MIQPLAELALKCVRAGNNDDGKKLIQLATNALDEIDTNKNWNGNLKNLHGISMAYKKAFEENEQWPEEIIEFSRKIDSFDASMPS